MDGEDPEQDDDTITSSATPTGYYKRARALATQVNAVSELRILSQPTTVPDITKLPNFVFEDDPGKDIYLYLIDSGVNTSPFVSVHLSRLRIFLT